MLILQTRLTTSTGASLGPYVRKFSSKPQQRFTAISISMSDPDYPGAKGRATI